MKTLFFLLTITIALASCSGPTVEEKRAQIIDDMKYNDAHSCAKNDEAIVKHLDLDLKVDFESQTLAGMASFVIENLNKGERIFFDTKNLNISRITLDDTEEETTFKMDADRGFLGQALEIKIHPNTEKVNIYYSTNPGAEALQWIAPEQTVGKLNPFLYTQSQAILARTWIPTQDGPGIRMTYSAKIDVPKDLMAAMSAANPQQKNETGIYNFKMDQPIPSYLMALVVGNFDFVKIGERTGVYAESEILEDCAYEFAGMEKMLEVAEGLYGAYQWGRYDVIVLPPSFPFGGMENPMLTFATPTIIAGDRSLTSLVAHELAHSWSGNLVTNATWEDFWLNEGFTVYFERRIMEEVEGASYAKMLELLGFQDLQNTLYDFELANNLKDSKLKLELDGRDPDEGLTDIAYEKGYFFLRMLENHFGREKFDQFISGYFNGFAFQTMTTEGFLDYVKDQLFVGDEELWATLKVEEWVYQPGLPDNCPKADSERFDQVNSQIQAWVNGTPSAELAVTTWTTHEWLQFLRHLPEDMTILQMQELDKTFNFTNTGNSEIACEWLKHSIHNHYEVAYFRLEKFLVTIGRRKFLTPLYKEMLRAKGGREMANKIYEQARPYYHAVSVGTMDKLLGWDAEVTI